MYIVKCKIWSNLQDEVDDQDPAVLTNSDILKHLQKLEEGQAKLEEGQAKLEEGQASHSCSILLHKQKFIGDQCSKLKEIGGRQN